MDVVEVNEKPIEVMRQTLSHYRFSTARGDVVLQMPSSIKKSELKGVKQMFELIVGQAERWASE